MNQFDVLVNVDGQSARWAPYLVVLQHNLLADLDTIVVAPLVRMDEGFQAISGLNPAVEFSDEPFAVSIQELAGISRANLGAMVGTLEAHRDTIIRALDILFTGI